MANHHIGLIIFCAVIIIVADLIGRHATPWSHRGWNFFGRIEIEDEEVNDEP